ncbi:MAG: tRNA (guanosine(37)-N1)-methyltransferase TrmD [Candidatus Spechtbacterales bacterium]
MKFDLLTIFPDIFDSYVNESIIGRARKEKKIEIKSHDIRKHAAGKHRITDDSPYGGGAGMVMKVEPIYKAVLAASDYKITTTKNGLRHAKSQRIILLSAKGEQFTQQKAEELSQYRQIILISGRYEGVDERVAEYIADEELSIGPYVLTGGELPSLVVADAVSRLTPGVLGNKESLAEESFSKTYNLKPKTSADIHATREYPQYTRPEIFSPKKGVEWKVPEVLLGGNHKKIEEWRRKMAEGI